MGYIKHNTIIVTGWQDEKVLESRNKAIEIFEKKFKQELCIKNNNLVSDIIEGVANGQLSFFIAPDGSKEGWEASQNGDDAREEFCDWLDSDPNNYCEYVEIRFGGDDDKTSIVRTNSLEEEE